MRKQILFILLLCFTMIKVQAQWNRIGTNTYLEYGGDKVGIGLLNPSEKLEIFDSNTTPGILSLRSLRNDEPHVNVGQISAKQNTTEVSRIGMARAGGTYSGYLTFWTKENNEANLTEKVRISESGKVGIGTPTPTYKLHTVGDIYADGGWFRVSGNKGLYFQNHGGGLHMVDDTWIRTAGNKSFYHNTGIMRTDGIFQVASSGSRFIVKETGNVGINNTNPPSKLALGTYTNTNVEDKGMTLGSDQNTIEFIHSNYGSGYGSKIYGTDEGNGKTGLRFAVRGNSTDWNDVIYLTASDNNGGSNGNVGIGTTNPFLKLHVNGAAGGTQLWIVSDKRFKTDIESIKKPLEIVRSMQGVTYNYNREAYPEKNLPEQMSAGYIAQDLEKILPVAVTKDNEGFYAVNYDAILPVLSEAIKEQQYMIEEKDAAAKETIKGLQKQINELKELVTALAQSENTARKVKDTEVLNTKVILHQNTPNPFTDKTIIRYEVPESVQEVQLIIYDMQGHQLMDVTDLKSGNGEVEIKGDVLKAGMYIYTLIADSQVIDTKRMILTK